MLDIIKYLKPWDRPNQRTQSATAVNLVNRIRLNIPCAGSYIIVSWFQLLCIYGLGDMAVAFYRDHKDILDAPYLIALPAHQSTSLFDAFKFSHHGRKRVEEGIHRSIQAGHIAVVEAFMNSEYRPMVDCEKFIKPMFFLNDTPMLEKLAKLYDGRFGTYDAANRQYVISSTVPLDLQELLNQIDKRIKELAALNGETEPEPFDEDTQPSEIPVKDLWAFTPEEKFAYPCGFFYDD